MAGKIPLILQGGFEQGLLLAMQSHHSLVPRIRQSLIDLSLHLLVDKPHMACRMPCKHFQPDYGGEKRFGKLGDAFHLLWV
ncbi:hypothetical protein SDC9_157860 [bioreactor metagenome]|uniref:Uncharacterized protein n=1 Tax=bioreactor metagenome TaxID=1076179 RepID=A0A645F868_9ZZZZ